MKLTKTEEEFLTKYWLEYYVNQKTTLCALCGNTGQIHTTQTAAEMIPYCICPNGRTLRFLNKAE